NPDSLSRSSELNVNFNGEKISVFQIVENYKVQALKLLGNSFTEEVYYHTYDLYNYYFRLLFEKNAWNEFEFRHLIKVTNSSLNDFLKIKNYPVDQNLLQRIQQNGVISWFCDMVINER